MAAIEVIVFAGSAGFAVIIVATVLVIIGVHQEQRVLEREGRQVFAHHEPPTILALLARRVLGAHFNVMPADLSRSSYRKPDFPLPRYPDPDDPGLDYPDEQPPWDDRPAWPEAS